MDARLWDGRSVVDSLADDPVAVDLLRAVLSGETMQDGSFRKITAEERIIARARLLLHPAWQAYRRALEQRLAPKHAYHAGVGELRKDWFAAVVHLKQMLKECPDDEDLKKRLATCESMLKEEQERRAAQLEKLNASKPWAGL
jgi:hypothetical protein